MNSSTRDRLIRAAAKLFAAHGYRGASVRDICNLAGANPGSVSYHFGGKHQLYRAVLRQAASNLADLEPDGENDGDDAAPSGPAVTIRRILGHIEEDEVAAALLLRDLADGGQLAVEALTPPLRAALDSLSTDLGHGDELHAGNEEKRLFLELAAPVFLFTAAWPVVSRALALDRSQWRVLAEEMIMRTLAAHGLEDPR